MLPGKEKSGPFGPLEKRQGRKGKGSGKAMQDDEVEANAKTLELEKTTILEEG
jgi:hypothetical protein